MYFASPAPAGFIIDFFNHFKVLPDSKADLLSEKSLEIMQGRSLFRGPWIMKGFLCVSSSLTAND